MYLKHFGLREPPFNLTPDPKFFFSSALHREALAALYYGIKSRKGFIVVTGEVGTGKTTLLRKLLRTLEATHHSVYIFNTVLKFEELLEYAVRDLGMEPVGLGRAALVQQLNEFLLAKNRAGHTVSLLIDEAQQLSEEALEAVRLLSNLETDREKLIQIILVGQPELENKLNRPSLRQLKQRVSLWSRLDCLNSKETETYIRHRLEAAGYQGPDIFNSAALKLICEYAHGTPRLINSICDNALLTAFATSRKVVSIEIVQEVIGDLRLKPPSHFAADSPAAMQPQPKSLRSSAEFDGKASVGEPDTRSRVARQASAPQSADVVYNLGLKRMPSEIYDSEQQLRRQPARNVANLAELKDRRHKDKERLDADELSDLYGPSRKGESWPAAHKIASPPGQAVVTLDFFITMSKTLTDAMGPMAALVLKEQIAGLGESIEAFPIVRLPELVAAIKREILSEGLRRRFEEAIAKQIQEQSSGTTAWRSSTK